MTMIKVATIQQRALLAKCCFSCYTGQRYDSVASAQYNADNGAEDGAARINLHTLCKKDIAEVVHIQNQYRFSVWRKHTLDWTSGGLRVLPTTKRDMMLSELALANDKLEPAKDRLAAAWPEIRERQKQRMGRLWQERFYPVSIRERFRISLEIMPIPSAGDFRVTMEQEAIADLQAQYSGLLASAEARVVADLGARILKPLTKMANTLREFRIIARWNAETQEFEETGRKANFTGALVKNLVKIADVIPDMNVTGNPELDRLAREIRALAQIDWRDLQEPGAHGRKVREEQAARAEALASDVDSILATMGDAPALEYAQAA